MIYLGIDPGLEGGFAAISDVHTAFVRPLPYAGKRLDVNTLCGWIRCAPSISSIIAVVEMAQVMPKQGAVSGFNYGTGYGMIQGALTAMGVRMELVRPADWKRVVLAGCKKDENNEKTAAIEYCARAFPTINLVQDGCRKQHDGCADALCLADYGRRTYASATGTATP